MYVLNPFDLSITDICIDIWQFKSSFFSVKIPFLSPREQLRKLMSCDEKGRLAAGGE